MALDIGERRIGLAISESGVLATPYGVLERKSKAEDFIRLQRIITEQKIDKLIIGLPYSLSAAQGVGPQARRVMRYTEALAEKISIPFEYFDESYSTVDARAYLVSSGRKKTPLDAAAAAVILQNYLGVAGQHEPETQFKTGMSERNGER
ncbi:MAG: Holliday junction resolvase RuvX [Anaerolineae bacterium]